MAFDSISKRGKHVRTRKYPGIRGRRPDNKKFRVDDAKKNMDARAGRTNEQQLARLDTLFGKGLGAKKERARLLKAIEAAAAKAKAPEPKAKTPDPKANKKPHAKPV